MYRVCAALSLSCLTALSVAGARAQTIFTYSGSQTSYPITQTGMYGLTAVGADGGPSSFIDGSPTTPGGSGASIAGSVSLTAGTTLQIVVGGEGGNSAFNPGGGGGGTFIFVTGALQPLLVAGGGGGAGVNPGGNGQTTVNGQNEFGPNAGAGGIGGLGGGAAITAEAGGAGWLGPGQSTAFAQGGFGPPSFAGGLGSGGCDGGFGGGGGSNESAGAGGGGYSGGGGGDTGVTGAGGGGGSYYTAAFANVTLGLNGGNSLNLTANGSFSIQLLQATPEPGALALLASSSIGGIGLLARKRRCLPS